MKTFVEEYYWKPEEISIKDQKWETFDNFEQ